MDLFQEARWYFTEKHRVTWYNDVIRKLLVKPRVPRFGIMTQVCSSSGGPLSRSEDCDHIIALRTNKTYAMENNFSSSYTDPLLLLSDVGGLEMNDRCKMCIEQGFEQTMARLTNATIGLFQGMRYELSSLAESGTVKNESDLIKLERLMQQIGTVAETVDRAAVEEFYFYYVVRGLYSQLGADAYVSNYEDSMQLLSIPCNIATGDPNKCPLTVTKEEAMAHLSSHADNTFSSITTAGAPFPFWSQADGTGYLFAGASPIGGSGIDMSGNLSSASLYLDSYAGDYIDPLTPESNWTRFVETDPIYRWFLAGVTPMMSRKFACLTLLRPLQISLTLCYHRLWKRQPDWDKYR